VRVCFSLLLYTLVYGSFAYAGWPWATRKTIRRKRTSATQRFAVLGGGLLWAMIPLVVRLRVLLSPSSLSIAGNFPFGPNLVLWGRQRVVPAENRVVEPWHRGIVDPERADWEISADRVGFFLPTLCCA
jgi:hypothetical protein